MLTCSIRDEQTGQVVGILVLKPKEFSTGRTGWHGVGKIEIDGIRYQGQGQLVRIGDPDADGR